MHVGQCDEHPARHLPAKKRVAVAVVEQRLELLLALLVRVEVRGVKVAQRPAVAFYLDKLLAV